MAQNQRSLRLHKRQLPAVFPGRRAGEQNTQHCARKHELLALAVSGCDGSVQDRWLRLVAVAGDSAMPIAAAWPKQWCMVRAC
jgi:hypothetical protein